MARPSPYIRADESDCERILLDLDTELAGAPGPYILSDLRYGAGPLYLRYGGFSERFCVDSRGEMAPAIEDPAGDLVPDLRSPVFTMPEWVRLPEFLAPHLDARNSVAVTDLEYDLIGALHFSNGGGVYTATDKRTGERVILKEARPHAGLAADGSDAVTRLRREHDVLLRLSGLGIAPEVRGFFQVGEHYFLAEEFIPGRTLNSFFVERYPLNRPAPEPEATKAYAAWALRICGEVERAAAAMHERGVVFNDVHMFNIIVRPDGTVAFIDFEAASDISEGRTRTVGNPGFAAPRDRAGFDVDAYSLACLRLAMFMPLTTLFALDRDKAAQLAGVIAALFPVPEKFLDEAVREITRGAARPAWHVTGPAAPGEAGETAAADVGGPRWDRLAADMVGAIRASATPERTDRLFPGDIDQFRVPGGGLGLAHGAAGVLYALSEAAGVRVPEYEEWLVARAADPPKGTHLGLYDGLAGVAYTLARLGHLDAAVRAARSCLERELGPARPRPLRRPVRVRARHDLRGRPRRRTMAGRRRDTGRGDRRGTVSDRRARRRRPARGGPDRRRRRPAARRVGEGAAVHPLVRADRGHGLPQCGRGRHRRRPAPVRHRRQRRAAGRRRLANAAVPGGGSVGIGMVIDQFTAHRQHAEFADAARAIRLAASSGLYAQAGLFNGRAGMIAYLAGTRDERGQQAARRVAGAHVDRLAWHAVRYEGGLAFPGDMLLRLSMDLGTGAAGVLLGTAAALAPCGAALPFFAQPARLPVRVLGSSRAPLREALNRPAPARR